jgi:hypothetical protein
VWDVAALHGTGGIAAAKSPETALGAAAISADVTGLGLGRFDQDAAREIMASGPASQSRSSRPSSRTSKASRGWPAQPG